MSASELEHRRLYEDRFNLDYEEIVSQRVKQTGPVSAEQIRLELMNEVRYDTISDPGEVTLKDSRSVKEIFADLRFRNRRAELDFDLGVIPAGGRIFYRNRDEPVVFGPVEESPYWTE